MPYWRLSAFYFFYFASLGALIPYWSLYLTSLHFSATQIGQLMAILMATKIIAPVIWGHIADRTGRGLTLVHYASLAAAVTYAGVFWVSGFWPLAVVMMLFSFFWNAALPQFEAVTLNYLGENVHRYTNIRLWGSVGFIVSTVVLGLALEYADALLIPLVVLILMIGIWLAVINVPNGVGHPHNNDSQPLSNVVFRVEVLALFAVCLLMQASHGPYYAFYTLYMEQHGYSRSVIGFLWALGVITEVIVFLIMYRLVPRYGLRNIFLFSLLLAVVRWILIGYFPQSIIIQLFAQTLHAATFGTYHAVAIQLIHKFFTGSLQGRGQALYSSLSFGAGGALGSYFSGYIWDQYAPQVIYYAAAASALLAYIIAWVWIRPTNH